MRVISGKYKRTPLITLDGMDITRPTRDMVKEALFSSIEINEDTVVLDLFSGSGAIGIEALSRGAKDAVFNDFSKKACEIINKNLSKIKENRTVLNFDYKVALDNLKGQQFSFVYVDPPYKFNEYQNVFKLLSDYSLVKDKGIIVVEVNKDCILQDSYFGFNKYKSKVYGINRLEYYIKQL